MEHLYTTFQSPVGQLVAVGDGQALTRLRFQDGRRPAAITPGWRRCDAAFAELRAQLEQYFAGRRQRFELELAPTGGAFERRVWAALTEVPYGATVSYGEIARRVGAPTSARAVGTANGRNPIVVVVPCHRVIGADGTLTGYGGGLGRKRWLLDLEAGVQQLAPAR